MSKLTSQDAEPINDQDLSELEAAHALLGSAIVLFRARTPEATDKAWETVTLCQDYIQSASGIRVRLPKPAKEILKETPTPPPPRDGFAISEIPYQVIKGPSTAEILSHVVERVDQPQRTRW